MSGGGGFRGRGFASRGHRRQGADGSRGANARSNRHDSPGGNARPQGPSGSRSGFHGGGSRSNVQSDGTITRGGVAKFRGESMGGPRQSFKSPRGPPMHQPQIPDNKWSGNNWSGNNWSDNNIGNNWSENNMGNNWSDNNLGNNWMDNNSGNNWLDNIGGNNWSDNNIGINWSGNNPGNNWSSPRGGGPSSRGYQSWGVGCPTRFNGPPIPPPFYRSPGPNTFVPYGFPPPVGTNYLPPSIVDYPASIVEPEPQNTQKPLNPPKAALHYTKKPITNAPKPQKQIVHPGSKEERLQKITEAADKLKRTLSTIKKGADNWLNEDDGGTLEFSQQDLDHEPRMGNRGIPELKHDPPELNLTLNDLRDIGRVDHDHTTRATKPGSDADPNIDESEVEILEHNPVERIPEATIDIDLWPEDNPDDSTENRNSTEQSNDISESCQTFVAAVASNILNDESASKSAQKANSKCYDDTIAQNVEEREAVEEITRDSDQDNRENLVKDNTRDINLDKFGENVASSLSSQIEEKIMMADEDLLENNENNENSQIEEIEADSIPHTRGETETKETELSENVENLLIDDNLENCENSKIPMVPVAAASTFESRKTSNDTMNEAINSESQTKEIKEAGMFLNEKMNSRENKAIKVKETREEKNFLLESQKKVKTRGESKKSIVMIVEKTEERREKMTIDSGNVASSNDLILQEEKNFESRVELADALDSSPYGDARTLKQNDHESPCDSVTNTMTQRNMSTTDNDTVVIKETTDSDVTMGQSENEAIEKVGTDKKKQIDRNANVNASTGNEYSTGSTKSADRGDGKKIKTSNIIINFDSQAREKIKEKSGKSKTWQEKELMNERSEQKKLEEDSQDCQESGDGKSRERKKLVRTGYDGISSTSRKSTTDSTVKDPNDYQSSVDGGTSPNSSHNRQTYQNQSPISSNFEKPNYGISISGKRSKEEISPGLMKLNEKKQRPPTIIGVVNDPVESVLPPAFDPRLSSHERSVLMSSSMPINQDFTMTTGYSPGTMTNLVPSVQNINYGVPVGVPPPTTIMTPASITPASNMSSISVSDPFVPILPLPNLPIVSPIVLPNELMLQPPLPVVVELPPPPPPPVKPSVINMEAELEDMQEAMEFAKQLMNMNDDSNVEALASNDIDPDISDESGFFHMPTFPDLPPIELPPSPPPPPPLLPPPLPLPLPLHPPPVETNKIESICIDQPFNKECIKKISKKNIKQEITTTYGPAPMPEEYQKSPSHNENMEESLLGLTEEQLRPKVVFNLNAKSKIINKHDEWHQQNQRDEELGVLSHLVSAIASKTAVVTGVGTKERSTRITNGHEERKKCYEKAGSTRYNGNKFDSLGDSRGKKKIEGTKSRSPSPSKHGIHTKNSKRDEEISRNYQTNKSGTVKESGKEIPLKKTTNDPRSAESSWKSRVIGRFLKMSKTDIGNMLNNASLRKFDIAMKHLVKERRSSLSLEMRNNEEERMRDAEVSYNREEFMDQLSAMLDPSATVDVCNLPTQFIHHLSEVLHLDTMSEFETSQTMSETIGDVSSPAAQSSPNSESRKQLGTRETPSERKRRRDKEMEGREEVVATSSATTPATTSATTTTTTTACLATTTTVAFEKCKGLVRTSDKTIAELSKSKRRRRVRATMAVQQSNTTTISNDGTLGENDSSSLTMADLDDIFSAGIARAKKKLHDSPIARTGKKKEESSLLIIEENNIAPVVKDPSVDRVERAVVELDEIFTAGIAKAKLASKKVAEAARPTAEVADDENDDDVDDGWNQGNLRTNVDSSSRRLRQRSSSSGRKTSKIEEKWSRHLHRQEPVAFRNLTKEEWEAKYSEPSYSTYQREYRAMEALREERSRRSPSSGGKPDYNTFDINDLGSIKSRLGEPVSSNVEYREDWSGSDELSRIRNINEAMNYTIDYNRSSADSSSTTTSTSSNSSENEDNEATTPSVTKLLKVIKEREKIAKQKSFNEEIRDEVTAEIERKKRERDKVRKRHRPRPKKSSHHRRRRDKKDKVRERKKRERKRRKRKSRRSGQESKESTENENAVDEEYMSSDSRDPRRLLNEDEIKKEIIIKEEPDVEIALSYEKIPLKSCMSAKPVLIDDSRPASTASSSSVPSIVPPSTTPQIVIAHQTKTKAQLKQMPVDIATKRMPIVANVQEVTIKVQHDRVINEETRENIVIGKNTLPVDSEIPNVSNQSNDNCSISNVTTTAIIPALSIQQISAPSDDTSLLKTNSKKLDIQTYKERTRQRQLKQNEKIRTLTENPSSLTQNLLNIPLIRKKDIETTEAICNPGASLLKDPRLKKPEETSIGIAISSDPKLTDSTITSNVDSLPNSTAKISISPGNVEENVVPSKPSRKKIVRPNFTTAQKTSNDELQSIPAKDLPVDAGKFAHIKSEGSKEMKLREKLRRGRLRIDTETPETGGPLVVPPTRLKRRRKSLVTTEIIVSATELTINQVPSSSKKDTTSTFDNSKTLEATKTANETLNFDNDEISSLTENSNPNKSFDISKSVVAATTFEGLTHFNEIQSLDISKHLDGTKTLDEPPKISDNIDTLGETLISPLDNSMTPDTAKSLETTASVEPTEALIISTNLDTTEILNSSKHIQVQNIPKSLDNSITLDSSTSLDNLKNPNVPIEPDNTETSDTKKNLDISEILDTAEPWINLQDLNMKELLEIPSSTLEKTKNSDGTTLLEASVTILEAGKTLDEPKVLLNPSSEELTESEIQRSLPIPKEAEKNDTILTETVLIPVEMPIEELPVWSLDAPAITGNIPESLDYSNDSVPFKGFTEETILRRDRVLTEAEIAEDSELATFENVPLNFVSETATSTTEIVDLDEITNTDIVDSLDSLPLTYSEQFPNAHDEIETSLPDPLGNTIFTVASEIVDVPVDISLEESMEIVPPVTKSNLLKDLSSIDDFLIDNVITTRETVVPSAIFFVQVNESKESAGVEELMKNTSNNKIEEVKTRVSENEATEEGTLSEELLINENKTEMPVSKVEPRLGEKEALDSSENVVPSEKNVSSEMRLNLNTSNDDTFMEDSEVHDVHFEPELKLVENQIEEIESSSQICDTKDDKIDKNVTEDIDAEERATNKEAERSSITLQEKHDSESKSKEFSSSNNSKEYHSHGRVKKKSSRSHNHGSKTSKKTTLTEKMVDDAITANVVKLVAKPNSRHTVMARMMEIDVEIHKLMNEKMTLYKMLESGDFTTNENQGSVERSTIDEIKMTSDKEIEMEAGDANIAAPSMSKTSEETTNKPQVKSFNLEIEDKTKKRKKSPYRETKHRSRERDMVAEPRCERKTLESKSHTSRSTLGEESCSHRKISLNTSREKSTSLTDLAEDTEEKRRKKDKSPTRQASKRHNLHSSREDLLDVSRDAHVVEKSTKSESMKREKTKKRAKPPIESTKFEARLKKSKNREGKSSSEKTKINHTDHIYSDESNIELQEPPNDSTKNYETSNKKDHIGSSTGLALLDESLKREMAHLRKTKNVEKRKKKRQELRRTLLDSTVLTASEAKTGLINLFNRKKLHKKENTTSSRTKDKTRSGNTGKVSKHVSNIIDAVATNRIEELYTDDARESPADDETLRHNTGVVQENRAIGDNENKESIKKGERGEAEKEEEEEEKKKELVSRSPVDELSNKLKKIQHDEQVKKSTKNCENFSAGIRDRDSVENRESQEEKKGGDSNHEEFQYCMDSLPVPSGTEILDIPKTTDIVAEENLINLESLISQKDDISNAGGFATKEDLIKNSETESRAEEKKAQEKQIEDGSHRSRSVTPEYPEPSGMDLTEKTNRSTEAQPEDSDTRWINEESVPRSRSRINSRRTKQRGKSPSATRKDTRSHHKDNRNSPPLRQEYASDDYDQDDVSSRRPRSATNRTNKHRERAGPPSRRGSRQSEENAKCRRSRKREHERSNSRGLSPYDGQPSRKRSQSHRSVTPTVLSTLAVQQSKKKGKKRKRCGEMSIEEMMRCKVELIDCKYTYLSPTMHPKILKKLGISRINRYVAPSTIIDNLSPPVLTRNETPSPPMLSKAFEAEYPSKETVDIIEKIEIPEGLENSVSTMKIVNEESTVEYVAEEVEQVRIPSPVKCIIVKENVDDDDDEDDDDEDDDDDDEDDDNIQIVKVLDENLPITPQGVEDDDVESVKDMEQGETNRIDTNENRPELIAVEEDYDTTEEYEIIDEVTDENEEETEETNDEVRVIDSTEAGPTIVTENPSEPEELVEPKNNDDDYESRRTRYTVHKGPILDIKVLEDSFLAASEDGAIYRYSQTSNGILNIYKGHEAAVTCIYVLEIPGTKRWNLYSGSLDGTFRCYDITTGAQDRSANVGSPVQCMDQGWGIIYIGTKSGHISRYSIKSGSLKGDRLEFSDKSVLALKASAEGPRRVLIVASRNQPITIRDANTGLFLRTICGYKNHTVYSLMRDRNLVYCGTSSTSIPVYDFTNGEQITQYNAGVGIVCMRLYRQILFAGCYDGNIYVFDTMESKLLCSIPGPGNMLLSMEVVNDEIIAGSKNRQLHSWHMPKTVRALLAERT